MNNDPAFDRQDQHQDGKEHDADQILLKVKEYLEDAGTPEGIEVARCIRTTKADGTGTEDGTEDFFVVVSGHIEEDQTLVAVRVRPDTGYESPGGYRYVWQQMAGGGSLPTGQYKDDVFKMVSQNQNGWGPVTARAM